MNRDSWSCNKCGDTDEMLTVHHKWYDKSLMPWEYPSSCYITLCNSCHNQYHKNEKDLMATILNNLKKSLIDIEDFYAISEAFKNSEIDFTQYHIPAIVYFLTNQSAYDAIKDLYDNVPISVKAELSIVKQSV